MRAGLKFQGDQAAFLLVAGVRSQQALDGAGVAERPGGDHRVAEQQAVRADLPGGRFKGAAEKVPVVENAQAAR